MGNIFAISQTSCFICKEATEYVLMNPNFGNETEHLLDKFCNYLPSAEKKICEKVAEDLDKLFVLLNRGFGKQQVRKF